MTIANTTHIAIDEKGRAYIQGTRSRVSMIVCDTMKGMAAEDIHREYPGLSMGQIYAALSYYYDHQAEVDGEIGQELEYVVGMRAEAVASGKQPTKAELVARFHERGPRP